MKLVLTNAEKKEIINAKDSILDSLSSVKEDQEKTFERIVNLPEIEFSEKLIVALIRATKKFFILGVNIYSMIKNTINSNSSEFEEISELYKSEISKYKKEDEKNK